MLAIAYQSMCQQRLFDTYFAPLVWEFSGVQGIRLRVRPPKSTYFFGTLVATMDDHYPLIA